MEYEDAVALLQRLETFGSKPGLERVCRLLAALGNPHLSFDTVHVAGTNGKGSTTIMIGSIFAAAGYRVGTFTSPHMSSYEERMRVGGEVVSRELFTAAVEHVYDTATAMSWVEFPTEFEMAMAVASWLFKEAGVDIAVYEVGLGGRLDATNAIVPLVAVITPVGFDHREILGYTLAEIAREKAGIIKPGVRLVSALQAPEVEAVLSDKAAECGVSLDMAGRDYRYSERLCDMNGCVFDFSGYGENWMGIRAGLVGRHQVANAAAATAACLLARQRGIRVDERAVRDGLKQVVWPGRLEVIAREPVIVLDGAHNPQGMKALVDALCHVFRFQQLLVVLGILQSKQVDEMLELIVPAADIIFCTQPAESRTPPVTAANLGQNVRRIARQTGVPVPRVEIIPNARGAVHAAKSISDPDDLICVCGSLYLIREVRGFLS